MVGGRDRRGDAQRGAALIEFALVLPLLALLAVGTVDIGRAYMAWNQVKGAAREGATYAQYFPNRATQGPDCPDPENVVHKAEEEADQTISVVTTRGATTLGCGGAAVQPGQQVVVTVTRSFDIITPIASQLFGDPVMIRSSVDVVVQG